MAAASPTRQQILTPQMSDYISMSDNSIWRPYVMYFHAPNFRSAAVNTDEYGFRFTHGPDGAPLKVSAENDGGRQASLLIGNSVAFGIGATEDSKCLASRLSAHTGDPWLNVCGRAFGSMQEWLLYHFHQPLFGSIKRTVIVSGLNDLYLFFAPKLFDKIYGLFFHSQYYDARMNVGTLTRRQAIFKRLFFPLVGDRVNWSRLSARDILGAVLPSRQDKPLPELERLISERMPDRAQITALIERNLTLWADAGQRRGFDVIFALQPMQPWVEKPLAKEERDLIEEQDKLKTIWHELVRLVLRDDVYRWYAEELSGICRRLGIQFIDLNQEMRENSPAWLFVDRVHLTDLGQDRAAAILAAKLRPNVAH